MRYFILATLFVFIGCKGETPATSNLSSYDLMKHGMPIKIMAPANPVVEASDMGIMKDVTVKGEGNYFLQITSGISATTDIAALKAQQLSEVKNALFFDEIIEEDENGFIYRKKISEDRINHDFRYIKIQGDQEYMFQVGLTGQYSLEDVQSMYASVK